MSPLIVALVGVLGAAAPDTSLVLGWKTVDLTGDGTPETLELVGEGPSLEQLNVTLIIRSEGTVLHRAPLAPLTPTVGFDAGRRRLSAPEYRRYLAGFGEWFFADEKILTPSDFLIRWRASTRLTADEVAAVIARDIGGAVEDGARVWSEIQASGSLVFEYSPGGDRVVVIAWSASAGRFVNLVECC